MSDKPSDDKKLLQEFKEWIRSDARLPQHMNDILLQRYLKVYNYSDLKKSQDLLMLNLNLRRTGPQLFTNRDFLSHETQTATRIMQACPMPKLTHDNLKVTIMRIGDTDAAKFDYVENIKMALMLFDARFTEYDADGKIADGECFVMDSKGMSFRHMLKMLRHMGTAQLYTKFVQDAQPFKIAKVHLFNASYVMHKVFALTKHFMSKEVIDIMHFHPEGMDCLHKYISKNCLPREYGGDLGSMDELHQNFIKFVESKRDYLMDDSNWEIKDISEERDFW